MRKPKINEELFLIYKPKYSNKIEKLKCKVIKVGKKYFYILREGTEFEIKFYINTWKEQIDWGISEYELYESEDDYNNKLFKNYYIKIIRDEINLYTFNDKINVEQIKKICVILNIKFT